MPSNSGPDVTGNLMKVIYVDVDTATAFFRISDGRTARMTLESVDDLQAGDVILSHDEGWTKVPAEVWGSSSLTSVVRQILEDGTILGESGNALLPLGNPKGINVSINSTVEIDGSSEIQRVLSNTPLRVSHHPLEDENSAASFLSVPSSDPLTFDDFGGYERVIAQAKELIDTQFTRRSDFIGIGARPIKGVLFSGPPGTGKTHLARIIASQSNADFYDISGPTIVSKWVGDSEGMLRRVFKHAGSSTTGRSIIFFDEIDSIAESRSGDTHEASRRLVAQLLTLMDGFDNRESAVMVIAATNRVEALDPALLRPGRFDWEIAFGLPSVLDRVSILEVGARRIQSNGHLPIIDLAIRTHNWSAARLSSIWTEAALIATSDKRQAIGGEDLALAYERIASRPERAVQDAT